MKTFENSTEEERKYFFDLGKLFIFKVVNDGMPPAKYLSDKARIIEQGTGINQERLQEIMNFLYIESMKSAFLSEHTKVGFKNK